MTSTKDKISIMKRGGIAISEENANNVEELMGGGKHFDDFDRSKGIISQV